MSSPLVEFVALETVDRLRKKTGAEEEEDVGRDDEEDGEVDTRAGGVDQVCMECKMSVKV